MATNSCGMPGDFNNYTNYMLGNITNNPLFIADGIGYGTNLVPGNYRLQAGSPCVNAGTNLDWMTGACDLDGLPRILKGTVDMGAYEEAHVFSYAPAAVTNTVMRGYQTNLTVYLTNSSPDIEIGWSASITSLWASGPSSGAAIGTNNYVTLTVTNDSYGLALGTFVSRMIVNALTNYPDAMVGYSQTGIVDMVMEVAEFARNPTQVVATVRQFGHTNRVLNIWNAGSGDIPYRVVTNASWLAAEPSFGVLTGNTAQAITVNFTNTALPLGVYYGTLTLVPGISGEPFDVNVELTVTTGPRMRVSPLNLTRSVMVGQDAEGQEIFISNSSTSEVINCRADWDQSWLRVSPSNSIIIAPGETGVLAVSYSTTGLTTNLMGPSNYNAVITVTATNTDTIGSPALVRVTVRVNPKARLAKDALVITNVVTEGQDAPSKSFKVRNSSGYYTLEYSLSDNVDWMVLSPASGTSTGEEDTVTVMFSTVHLTAGVSNAVITITGRTFDGTHYDNASDATQQVAVTVLVTPRATLATDSRGEYGFSARYGRPGGDGIFRVWNESSGGGGLEYRLEADAEWLRVEPSSGASYGEKDTIRFVCDATGLKPGTYRGVLRVSGRDVATGSEANNSPTNIMVVLAITANSGFDFGGEGSGASDLVVYKEREGAWGIRNLLSGFATSVVFGGIGYVPVPGDYDGDGVTDLGVYRYGSGHWYARGLLSSELAVFGGSYWSGPKLASSGGFTPVGGDYDGDGVTDAGMYRETSGLWGVLLSGRGYEYVSGIFGGPGFTGIPADYDGDGMTDPAVYNENTAQWYVLYSGDGYRLNGGIFGGPGFRAVPADYDGDGKADAAVYNETSGLWIVLPSGTLTASGYAPVSGVFGGPGFVPAPGDYDGDGKTDAAVYNELTGEWYIVAIDGSRVAWPVQHGGYGFLPVKP